MAFITLTICLLILQANADFGAHAFEHCSQGTKEKDGATQLCAGCVKAKPMTKWVEVSQAKLNSEATDCPTSIHSTTVQAGKIKPGFSINWCGSAVHNCLDSSKGVNNDCFVVKNGNKVTHVGPFAGQKRTCLAKLLTKAGYSVGNPNAAVEVGESSSITEYSILQKLGVLFFGFLIFGFGYNTLCRQKNGQTNYAPLEEKI